MMNPKKKLKLIKPELEAEIHYLTPEEGGRKNAIISGYRGQFFYDENDYDAAQELIDKDICNAGETVKVYLQTLSPNFHIGKFFVDKYFEIREGRRIVGKGKITKIIRPDFEKIENSKFVEKLTINKPINVCDECGSKYYQDTSQMQNLCPECSYVLYCYENCVHNFKNGRCLKCFWDGSSSDYINSIK